MSTAVGGKITLRVVLLGVMLSVTWLVWSGFFKTLLLSLGAFSVLLTLWLTKRTGYFSHETFGFRYDYKILGYWVWLAKEVVLSSLDVTKEVLRPTIRIQPRTVELDVSDLEPLDQATYGNCITLTPGTLTLDIYQNRLLVHALTENGEKGLLDGAMHRRVKALRG
ncbi:MAG: Na+/H+ antiporter subunit E [Pseudomonadota bacterium]